MTSENNPYEHRHIDTDNESEKFLQLFIRIMSDCKLASDNAVDLYAANMLCSWTDYAAKTHIQNSTSANVVIVGV